MRRAFFNAVAVLLGVTSLAFAESATPSAPPNAARQESPAPDGLPPRPLPVAVPFTDRPAPVEVLPAPTPAPPQPPPSPPLPPPPLPDTALDGFAVRFWASADYLLWWIKDDRLPSLVTQGSLNDRVPGAIGQPGTHVLFGGDINNEVRSGGRFRAGYWLTQDHTLGIDGSFFFLGSRAVHFADGSDGSTLLTRPFFNVNSNVEDASIVAFPGRQGGLVTSSLSSNLWGAEANLRSMLCRGPSYQVSLLGGFRFLELNETLRIKELDTIAPQSISDPTVLAEAEDHFHTHNHFYGGQIGTDFMWCRGPFSVDFLGKVALGVSNEIARINGQSGFVTSAGQSGTLGVGQLALPSNIGCYGKNAFAVVPEFGLNLGYALTPHIRLTFGYTFLFWSRVFRPGDQIDRAANTTEVPALLGTAALVGPARPNFTFKDSDFWAQGLNFGVQFRY